MDSYNSWNRACDIDQTQFSIKIFEQSFQNMYKITNVVKLRDFQYRLLHKRVPSKKELFRWKIKKSYQCIYL